jgi:hypothetical protein
MNKPAREASLAGLFISCPWLVHTAGFTLAFLG